VQRGERSPTAPPPTFRARRARSPHQHGRDPALGERRHRPVTLPNLAWGNLIINLATIGGDWSQGANFQTVNRNLTVLATGSERPRFRLTGGGTRVVDILGDYSQAAGVSFSGLASTITVNVGGDFTLSGGIFSTAEGVNVVSTLSLSGDFSTSAARSPRTATRAGSSRSRSSGVRPSPGGVVTQTIGWLVAPGHALARQPHRHRRRHLHAAGRRQPGDRIARRHQRLELEREHPDRQLAHLQQRRRLHLRRRRGLDTGSGLPAGVRHLSVDNPAGVALTNGVTVNGTLSLSSGALDVGARTLTLNGDVIASGGTIASAPTGSVAYNAAAGGQAVAAGSYGHLSFSNAAKTLAPSGTIAIAGSFAPGAATGHAVAGSDRVRPRTPRAFQPSATQHGEQQHGRPHLAMTRPDRRNVRPDRTLHLAGLASLRRQTRVAPGGFAAYNHPDPRPAGVARQRRLLTAS
jgi:hypothetical protein